MLKKHIVWILAGVLFFILFSVPGYFIRDNLVGSGDDASYVAHAFTIGLDADLDYSNEITKGSPFYNSAGTMPSHQIGTGFLAAPFVALFGIIDRITGNPVIQDHALYRFSWSYFGFAMAASLYYITGLYLYYSASKRIWPEIKDPFAVLLALSSGAVHFAIARFTMSHSFEYFSFGLLLLASVRLVDAVNGSAKEKAFMAALTAFSATLTLWIRLNDLTAIILPLLAVCVFVRDDAKLRNIVSVIALYLGFAILFFLPLAFFNQNFFGSLFPKMADVYSVLAMKKTTIVEDFYTIIARIRFLPSVMFSAEFGLIYTNPVIPVSIGLCITMIFTKPKKKLLRVFIMIILCFLYYGLSFGLVLYWGSVASSYGYRYMLQAFAGSLLIIGAVFNPKSMFGLSIKPKVRAILIKGLMIMAIWSLVNVFFFRSAEGLGLTEQPNIFGRTDQWSARHYEVELVKSFWRPKVLAMAVAKSGIGFIVYPFMRDSGLVQIIPQEYTSKYLHMFDNLPASSYLQYMILIMLWGGAGLAFSMISARGAAKTPEAAAQDRYM